MTRAPLLRLGGADGGPCLTFLDVDAEDRDADLVADPEDTDSEEPDAIRRGIQELPRRQHLQDRIVAALYVLEDELEGAAGRAPPTAAAGGVVARRRRGGPSYATSSRSYRRRKNAVHISRLSG
jgi:hypothetical protein